MLSFVTMILIIAQHPCSNINNTAIGCISPKIGTPINQELIYRLELDNVMFPLLSSNPRLQVRVVSDPRHFELVTKVVTLDLMSSSNFVLIQVISKIIVNVMLISSSAFFYGIGTKFTLCISKRICNQCRKSKLWKY